MGGGDAQASLLLHIYVVLTHNLLNGRWNKIAIYVIIEPAIRGIINIIVVLYCFKCVNVYDRDTVRVVWIITVVSRLGRGVHVGTIIFSRVWPSRVIVDSYNVKLRHMITISAQNVFEYYTQCPFGIIDNNVVLPRSYSARELWSVNANPETVVETLCYRKTLKIPWPLSAYTREPPAAP